MHFQTVQVLYCTVWNWVLSLGFMWKNYCCLHFYTMHNYFTLVGSFNGYSLFCCCNQGISCKYFFFSYPGFCNLDHSFLHQFFPGRKFVFIISWNNLFAGCNNIAWKPSNFEKRRGSERKNRGGALIFMHAVGIS